MQSYDQFDLHNSGAGEYLARWALMVEAATRRSPRSPDFSGLDNLLARARDERGGVITTKFA
eukprot:6625982-Lingulodinium_polyedra.AAC.1